MAGFDPTQVPTSPVEIDWSHPLAEGIGCLFIPGYSLRDLARTELILAWGSGGAIGGSASGPIALNNSTSTSVNALSSPTIGVPPSIAGGNQFTVICDTNILGAPSSNAYYFYTAYNATGGTPYILWGTSVNNSGDYSFYLNNDGTINTDLQTAVAPAVGRAFLAVTCQIGGNSNLYLNNSLLGTASAGSSVPVSSSTSYVVLGNGSNSAIKFGSFYNSILTPQLMAWLNAEPFAMLRPVRRRTYFVPASAPSSNIGASLVATSSLSASLRGIGAIRASAAATSQVTSSFKGVGTVGASLAGISRASGSTLGAGKMGADLVAVSAISATTRGAGSLKASLIGSSALSAAAHGVGTISAHLAATSSLSSAWFILPNIGASLAATSALSVSFVGAFPILPGRSISVLPSIRFIVAPVPIPIPGLQFRVPTFSPRAPNDVDFFTVDLGETGSSLIGTPAVTVPTGDLTIAGVTVSGSHVTFTVSGPGTPAAYSQLAIAWQTGNGAFSQTFQVLTNGFVAAIPVNSPAGILLPAPFFGSRATGDVSYFQLDMTGIVPAGAAITSAMVSCPTGDMTVGAVLWTATSVAWEGSGAGTIGQASGFAVQVAISTGAQLTFFAAIETMAPP